MPALQGLQLLMVGKFNVNHLAQTCTTILGEQDSWRGSGQSSFEHCTLEGLPHFDLILVHWSGFFCSKPTGYMVNFYVGVGLRLL